MSKHLNKPNTASWFLNTPDRAPWSLINPDAAPWFLNRPGAAPWFLNKPDAAPWAVNKTTAALWFLNKASVALRILNKTDAAPWSLSKAKPASRSISKPGAATWFLIKTDPASWVLIKKVVVSPKSMFRCERHGTIFVKHRGLILENEAPIVWRIVEHHVPKPAQLIRNWKRAQRQDHLRKNKTYLTCKTYLTKNRTITAKPWRLPTPPTESRNINKLNDFYDAIALCFAQGSASFNRNLKNIAKLRDFYDALARRSAQGPTSPKRILEQ